MHVERVTHQCTLHQYLDIIKETAYLLVSFVYLGYISSYILVLISKVCRYSPMRFLTPTSVQFSLIKMLKSMDYRVGIIYREKTKHFKYIYNILLEIH